MKENKESFIERHASVILVIGLLCIVFAPIILIFFNLKLAGKIGDSIDGITSPFVGILGVVLVYISFIAQQRANKNQWDFIRNKDKIEYLDKCQIEILEHIKCFENRNKLKKYTNKFVQLLNSEISNFSYYQKNYLFELKLIIFLNLFSVFCSDIKASKLEKEIKELYFNRLYLVSIDIREELSSLSHFLAKYLSNELNHPKILEHSEENFKNLYNRLKHFEENFSYSEEVSHNGIMT